MTLQDSRARKVFLSPVPCNLYPIPDGIIDCSPRHELSGSCPKVSSSTLFRCDRAGARNSYPTERDYPATDRSRVYFQRPSRHWQDHHRAHSGHGAQLSLNGHAFAGTLRHLRFLPRDSRRKLCRCNRDRRGHQPRHR